MLMEKMSRLSFSYMHCLLYVIQHKYNFRCPDHLNLSVASVQLRQNRHFTISQMQRSAHN